MEIDSDRFPKVFNRVSVNQPALSCDNAEKSQQRTHLPHRRNVIHLNVSRAYPAPVIKCIDL